MIEEIKEILAVAFVSRPAMPDARLTEIPVDTGELEAALGPGFWRACL